MVDSAPRYDPRIIEAVRMLDDPAQPIAETCRRIGAAAGRLGLPRPSYVHLRRLILEEREHQDAVRLHRQTVRAVQADVAERLLLGRFVDAYEVAQRLEESRRLLDRD